LPKAKPEQTVSLEKRSTPSAKAAYSSTGSAQPPGMITVLPSGIAAMAAAGVTFFMRVQRTI
jgi:hypothetical protein